MRTIDILQKTPEWLRWRAAGVSASDAAAALGLSPYKTPWRLWAERTGQVAPEDRPGNPHIRRGEGFEDPARRAFEDRHGTFLLPLCGESREHPAIRASFDGIDDDGCPVELKIPCPGVYEETLELRELLSAYRLYSVQVQTQLYVAEAERGWLVFHCRPGIFQEFEIRADRRFQAETLVPGLLAFWDAVQTKREPTPDPARDLYVPRGEALERWTRLAAEYRRLDAERTRLDALAEAAKTELDALEALLVAAMGDFLLADTGGLRLARFRKSGSIDYKAALAELAPAIPAAALERFRRAPSACVKVTVRADGPSDAAAPPKARKARTPRGGAPLRAAGD